MGTIVGHIKDFVLGLIELGISGEQRRLENEQRKEALWSARIESAQKLVGLTKEIGYSDIDLRRFVQWVDDRQGKLLDLAEQGKIRGVDLLGTNTYRGPCFGG